LFKIPNTRSSERTDRIANRDPKGGGGGGRFSFGFSKHRDKDGGKPKAKNRVDNATSSPAIPTPTATIPPTTPPPPVTPTTPPPAPTPTETPPSAPAGKSKLSNKAMIRIIVAAIVVGVLILGLLTWWLVRHFKGQDSRRGGRSQGSGVVDVYGELEQRDMTGRK